MSHYSRPRSDSIASRNSRMSNRSNGLNQSRGASAASGNYGAMAGPTLTPANDHMFEACAATASYFIYAQMNVILVLHHDSLDIERRFERHREDVRWIQVDNVSERGAGRLAVSYDASQTAIVWDIFTGDELARFASYEEMRTAAWMKNGEIAFGQSICLHLSMIESSNASQAMTRETLFCLTRPRKNTFHARQYMTPSQQSHRR